MKKKSVQCVFIIVHRNAEANSKSTKHHLVNSSHCQSQPPLRIRSPNEIIKPNDLHRQSPQFMDPLDDDTDPDVIPNQYGEFLFKKIDFQHCYSMNLVLVGLVGLVVGVMHGLYSVRFICVWCHVGISKYR